MREESELIATLGQIHSALNNRSVLSKRVGKSTKTVKKTESMVALQMRLAEELYGFSTSIANMAVNDSIETFISLLKEELEEHGIELNERHGVSARRAKFNEAVSHLVERIRKKSPGVSTRKSRIDDALLHVVERIRNKLVEQFFQTRIGPLLAACSRKHKTKVAAQGKRREALYRTKIRDILKDVPNSTNKMITDRLVLDEWIHDTGDNWSAVTSEDVDGRPDNSKPAKLIKYKSMGQAISVIKNNPKKGGVPSAVESWDGG